MTPPSRTQIAVASGLAAAIRAAIAKPVARTLTDYARIVQPGYATPPHIRALIARLERIESGELKRLVVCCPPRHGKSVTCSTIFPAWYLGRHPDRGVIAASYGQALADDFGRRVRNLIASDEHRAFFPGSGIAPDSAAAQRFALVKGGTYFAVGRGAAVTGRGGDVLIVDDPLRDREEADSETVRRSMQEWYSQVAYTRLQPNGAVLVIECMVGSTPVLMADGTEKELRSVMTGDSVASYEGGRIISASVTNWANQGPDFCYEIKTNSGKVVKANARHPFLVDRDGGLTWVKVLDLKIGDAIVRAVGLRESERDEVNALTMGVKGTPTIEGDATNITTESGRIPLDITANGGMSSVPLRDAIAPSHARDTAWVTTKRRDGQAESVRLPAILNHAGPAICGTGMASGLTSTTLSLPNRMEDAPCAMSCPERTSGRIGEGNYASIIATTPESLGACSATTATLSLDTERPSASSPRQHATFGITRDAVIEIIPFGYEDVFDIQVEPTGNFIANGLVSHNTRWHMDDLAGWLISEHADEGWEVLSFPAIAEEADELGRKEGDALWPERFDLEKLRAIKAQLGGAAFSALYQQRPAAAEGAIFKRAWWGRYSELPETFKRVIQVWDTAFKSGDENDFSACTTWAETSSHYYLVHAWRGRVEFPALISKAKALAEAWKPTAVLIEDKASGQSLIQTLRVSSSLPVLPIKVGTDKVSRANAVTPLVEAGKALLPVAADWLDDYLDEISAFPTSKHDDWTDTTTMALGYLKGDQAAPGSGWLELARRAAEARKAKEKAA